MGLRARFAATLLTGLVIVRAIAPATALAAKRAVAPPSGQSQQPQSLEAQRSTGPVDCFTDAKSRTFLTDEQAERLCRCQLSAAPVECFVQAKHRTFLTDERAMQLCSSGDFAPLGCVNFH